MTIIPIDTAVRAPSRPLSATPRLVPVRSGRWRVVDGAGRIIGHLDDVSDQHGSRFRASRYRRATTAK